MLFDLLVVFLSSIGFIVLIWCFLGFLLRPVFPSSSVTFYRVSGDGEDLEQYIAGYAWFRQGRNSGGRLVILDRGLSEQGRYIVQVLMERHDWICYIDPTDASDAVQLIFDQL